MALASLIISIAAFVFAAGATVLQLRTARQANDLPVLVELFAEHRSPRLAEARTFVFEKLHGHDIGQGLAGLPEHERGLVRDLAWYYDNLGVLVTHGHIDVAPVSGYLGSAAQSVWKQMQPLVEAERQARSGSSDPSRWQAYFENLVRLVDEAPPLDARRRQRRWRLG
ncbi:DUF4760 domain-containing protein [Nocardioides lianchengensis]|uniref:DUF4760 domain-containing protein n=1 Tax=Nocardioides lianchengensis TaxID=1045774 RepID=UPI001113867B|nr:hypothetical protein [Nocardioides lianchengensis]NYG08768.1 hypothetical protein [Nocardioides lianchengensis]